MRTLLLGLAAILAALAAPTAAAEPHCLQVYPWSELCEGDVDGFLDAVGERLCNGPVCVEVDDCVTDLDCLAPIQPCPGGPPCPPDPTRAD